MARLDRENCTVEYRHGPARPGHLLTHVSELTDGPVKPGHDAVGAIARRYKARTGLRLCRRLRSDAQRGDRVGQRAMALGDVPLGVLDRFPQLIDLCFIGVQGPRQA
jgi:hypothetical protein